MYDRDLDQPYLTTGEAARLCHLSPDTVKRYFDRGVLEGFRVGGDGERRIARESVARWVACMDSRARLAGPGWPSGSPPRHPAPAAPLRRVRAWPRRPAGLPVQMHGRMAGRPAGAGLLGHGLVADLSEGGALLIAPRGTDERTALAFELRLRAADGAELTLPARVVRVHPSGRALELGIVFEDLPAASAGRLRDLLATLPEGPEGGKAP